MWRHWEGQGDSMKCPKCDGKGYIVNRDEWGHFRSAYKCNKCGGTGKIEKKKEE